MNKLPTQLSIKARKNCKVCFGKDASGVEIRLPIEQMKAEGKTGKAICEAMSARGVSVSPVNLSHHFKKHAAYIQKGVAIPTETAHAITTLTHSTESAKQAIQTIIAYGNQMIDNWWRSQNGEDVTGPKMPISERMMLGAIAEEGRRAPKTALDADFEKLTRQAIEGEVVDAKPSSNP